MLYLSYFGFPSEDEEWEFRKELKRTSYSSIYPFYVLPQKGMREIYFKPITILYGGNGSGKSTVLNVIAEKLRLDRDTPYNRSPFFEDYVDKCVCSLDEAVPRGSRIVTSDDVFDFMLSLRALNEGIDNDRDRMIENYHQLKKEHFQLRSLDDYEHLKQINEARRKTESRFVREIVGSNIAEHSNGESARQFFKDKILDDTLCLLDEPENSLSPANQLALSEYLAESVRYCGNQFVISTHSPFLLALEGARIIDLDSGSRVADSWTELEGVKVYRDFFKAHEREF